MVCKICNMLQGKEKSFKIFEDDKAVAFLTDEPFTIGHIILTSKDHFPIIEQVPDELVGHLLNIANKISVVLFEKMQLGGTNILINNGIAAGQEMNHIIVNIIPRTQNDGINLNWEPKKISEDEMGTLVLQIQEQTKDVGVEKTHMQEVVEEEKTETISGDEEENYLIKQLKRLP